MNVLNIVIITIFSIIVYYMSIYKKECNKVHYVPIYDYKEAKPEYKIDTEQGEVKIPVNNLINIDEPISIYAHQYSHHL